MMDLRTLVLACSLVFLACSETHRVGLDKAATVELIHCDGLRELEAGCVDVDFRAVSIEELAACDGQFRFLPFGAMHLSSLVGALGTNAHGRIEDARRDHEGSNVQSIEHGLQVLGFVGGHLRTYVTRVEGSETTFEMAQRETCEFDATARDMFLRVRGERGEVVVETSLSQRALEANPASCGWDCPGWSYVAP